MTDTERKGPLIFGEVLFDSFPDGNTVLGGAPFNVAWHLQAFNMAPVLVSSVGTDALGEQVLSALGGWSMSTAGVQCDADHPTGEVSIAFRHDGEPEYTIRNHQSYDYIHTGLLPEATGYPLLYHGSLAVRNAVSREALSALKSRHAGDIIMDVNLREPWWERERVLEMVNEAHWVKLNVRELEQLSTPCPDLRSSMSDFIAKHALRGLVVTLGKRGAVALTDSSEYAETGPPAATPVVDTVGAGDAFTAVIIVGLMYDWPLRQTLLRAQAFASEIVQRQGAIAREADFYRAVVSNWHEQARD